jgi:hypothetical protein
MVFLKVIQAGGLTKKMRSCSCGEKPGHVLQFHFINAIVISARLKPLNG